MNRKQRRANPTTTSSFTPLDTPLQTAADIPLSQPDRSGPKAKTLYEYAAEREAELAAQAAAANEARRRRGGTDSTQSGNVTSKSTRAPTKYTTAAATSSNADDDDAASEAATPFATALLLTTTLSMLHFTLAVLVHHQYQPALEFRPIVRTTAASVAPLFVLVYASHAVLAATEASARWAPAVRLVRQVVFCGAACAAGCYLVHVGNRYQYFAVMKRAPPVGTLWVWCVLELGLGFAVASLVVVGGWGWWMGYGFF